MLKVKSFQKLWTAFSSLISIELLIIQKKQMCLAHLFLHIVSYFTGLNAPISALNLSLNLTIKGPFGRISLAFSINA